jgi:hypothetical protein
MGEDWDPDDNEWSEHWLSIMEPWFRAAYAWLQAEPERDAELEAWHRRNMHRSGIEWPGWAASPAGPAPKLSRPNYRRPRHPR